MDSYEVELKKKIFEISKIISSIQAGFYIIPQVINYSEEREIFFKNSNYNPKFNYITKKLPDHLSEDINNLYKFIEKASFPEDLYNYFYKELHSIQNFYNLRLSLFTNLYAEKAEKAFEPLLEYSKLFPYKSNIVRLETLKDQNIINATQIKDKFYSYLQLKNMKDWIISIELDRPRVSVFPKQKMIKIGANTTSTELDLKRLIVHEIETHVFREINSENQVLYTFRKGLFSEKYIIEEGLAVYNEVCSKTITKRSLNYYIARYDLVENRNKSFSELFKLIIIKYNFSNEIAFDLVYRLKRGLYDTSHPGGNLKDASYLIGYELLKEYMEKGGDISFLYSGKVSLREEIFSKYNLINYNNLLLPSYLNSK